MSIKDHAKTFVVGVSIAVAAGLILSFLTGNISSWLENPNPITNDIKSNQINNDTSQPIPPEEIVKNKPDIIIIPKMENQVIVDNSIDADFINSTIGQLNIGNKNTTYGDGCKYDFAREGEKQGIVIGGKYNIPNSEISIQPKKVLKNAKNLDINVQLREGCQAWVTKVDYDLQPISFETSNALERSIVSDNFLVIPLDFENMKLGEAKFFLPINDEPRYFVFSYDDREVFWWDLKRK